MKYKYYPGSRNHHDPSLQAHIAREDAKKARITEAIRLGNKITDSHNNIPELKLLLPEELALYKKEKNFRSKFKSDVENFHITHPDYNGQVAHEINDPTLEKIVGNVGGLAARAINAGEPNVIPINRPRHVHEVQVVPERQGNVS